MFPIILIMSLVCQGQTTDYGTEFVTAFPENLAYYYPATLTLTLKLTTLIPGTNINVFLNGQSSYTCSSCPSPSVIYVPININAEVNQIGPSGNVVKIVSTNNITVYSISIRGDSIQTSVVLPTRNLGMQYLVPSFNYTDLAVRLNTYNVSQFIDTTTVPMDFSFRLLIINAEAVNNTVTVTQTTAGGTTVITLGPYSLNQLPSSNSYFQVSSTGKVAVILTNPCIDTPNCKCNMVAHQLRPTSLLGNTFLYPYYNATGMGLFVATENNVDITSGSQTSTVTPGSIAMLPYFPGLSTGSTILTTSQSASVNVIYPGLIVELLPTTRFAGCYLVHSTKGTSTSSSMALIITQTSATGGVQMGTGSLTSPTWNALNDTGYSYTFVSISSPPTNFIWHPSSPIGVYIIETSTIAVTFGGPAIVLNDEPDPNGCVVVPTPFVLSNNTMSWQASRAFCERNQMVLASPNLEFTQNKMVQSLINMNAAGDVWLGMRRNLTTSNWYWNSGNDIAFTNWDDNEPSSGMCVSLTVDESANFKWSTERCCTPMQPLCEGTMVILKSITDAGS